VWCRVGIFFKPIGRIERGEEIQESKARCPGPQEEGDEESDSGEEEKETGVKARSRSNRSVAAALGRFRRQDQRSIVPSRKKGSPEPPLFGDRKQSNGAASARHC